MPVDKLPSLSIIIPALNEEHGIGAIVDRVLATGAALQKEGVTCLEVIVVDDGSHDQTAAVVEAYLAPSNRSPEAGTVRLMRHGQNRGYGAALKTGLAEAGGDLIAFLTPTAPTRPCIFPSFAGRRWLARMW